MAIQKQTHTSDGRATSTSAHCTVLATVNGPLETARREELHDASILDVNIRPLSGSSGPRERYLEDAICAFLRSVILVHTMPRAQIQVTLQFIQLNKALQSIPKAKRDLSALSVLYDAAFLAVHDAGLPLKSMAVAVLTADGIVDPSVEQLGRAKGLQLCVCSANGNVLQWHSEGEWDADACRLADHAAKEKLASLRQTLVDDARSGIEWRGF
ncbi:hypothetical protein K470DRAFT_272645 [Piedraia hortae CBS 480.64]|uniref:Exoribonuclease phosphorolytic domain-containing protein n=1 Tax=Piedraia hortae CBS 480.64 TaxID=1314780 RepID=A0A6A7BSM8_9PEZI|nr:hypothetical protein K470DRAFT_272645 [Piedraia hortae CBS 480.64]